MGVLFYCMERGEHMTDVHCNKKQCLNNCKGWCKAKAIHIDGVCRSYAAPTTLMRGCHQLTTRTNGRKRAIENDVIK